MSIGRKEVAEAFIDVHGDLSNFRKDLEKANADMQKLAAENADSFADAWGKRVQSKMDKQWNSVIDTLHSGKKLDFDKMIGNFDTADLDEAAERIDALMEQMNEAGKITGKNYKNAKQQINDLIKAQRQLAFEEKDALDARQRADKAIKDMHSDILTGMKEEEAQRERLAEAWKRANQDMVDQLRDIRKAYDESFDGMFRTEQAKRLTEDLKGMVKAMESADWSKFAKGFDSLDDMAARIREANNALFEQGKITRENMARIQRASDEFIQAKRDEEQAIIEAARSEKIANEDRQRMSKEALDAARAAREESERLDRTFEQMVKKATVRKIEEDFRRLSEAVATGDWSNITRGHENMDSFQIAVNRTVSNMHSLGRISDSSMDGINFHLRRMGTNAAAYNTEFRESGRNALDLLGKLKLGNIAMNLLARGAENMAKKLAGMGGFNVVTDMLRQGSEFMQNIDRHAVQWAKNMTIGAGVTSAIVSSLGGIATIGADLGRTLGGLAAFIPAFGAGLGIGVGTLVAALKDMKTVLKDLGPGFKRLQDVISKSFWDQAAKPIRDMVNNWMPLLNEKLTVTSENLGGMFTEFTRVMDDPGMRERAAGMFDRMNSAIKITQGMVAPLTNAFATLAEAGSMYFERFGTWLVDISNQFNNFIQKAAADGRLQKWFDDAIQGLKDLWSIASSAVGIFGSISKAAEAAGSQGLHGFAQNVAEIEKVMSSERFQKSLTIAFQSAGTVMQGFKEGLKLLGPAFEAALPTLAAASLNFKGIIETALGYLATFISNPEFLKGFLNFTSSIKGALESLAPAIPVMAAGLGGLLTFMGSVLEQVARIVSEVIIKVGPVFDRMMEKLAPLIPVIGDLASKFIDALVPILETFVDEILPPLIDLLADVAPELGDFLKQISPGVVDAIKSFAKVLRVVVDVIDGITDALASLKEGGDFEWLGTMIEAFASGPKSEAFDKMGENVRSWFKSLLEIDWEGLGKTIADGWNRLWNGDIFGDQPGKFFREADDNMNQWWDDTIGAWWDDTIGPWFDGIKGMIEDGWNGFTSWLDELFGGGEKSDSSGGGGAGSRSVGQVIGLEDLEDQSKWDEFWGGVQENVSTFFSNIGTWIEEKGAELKEGWDGFWSGFGEKVSEIWNGMVTWITEKYTEISTNLTTWWTGVKEGWDGFWAGVGKKVEEVWNGMVTWIVTKYTEISTNISTFITTVKTNWDNFWKGVGDKVVEIWNAVKTWIETKVGEVKTNIDNFIRDVRTNWDNFWRGVGETVSRIWQSIITTITTFVGNIRGNIDTFISGVRTMWDNGWRMIQTVVSNVWDGIVRAVQGGVQGVIGFVQGLPDRIRGFLSFDLSGAGRAIMDGFLSGLKSMWSSITSFVGGIADWIKNNKGPIEYDRVLLTPAGQAIMKGLVDGLEDGMAPLTSQLHDVTDLLRDSIVSAVAESEMYRAGADAAMGLADGLASKKQALADTFAGLLPDAEPIGIRVAGSAATVEGVGGSTPGKQVIIQDGAIRVEAPESDGEIVAAKVVDEIVESATLI